PGVVRVDAYATGFVWRHLPQLDEDDGAVVAERPVPRTRWIPQVPPRRIMAVLIRKRARQDQDLLTAGMLMMRESGTRCVTHDAGRPRTLVAHAVQHHALDTGLRR